MGKAAYCHLLFIGLVWSRNEFLLTVKSGCKINGTNQSSAMKDTLDGTQRLSNRGEIKAKTIQWHYYENPVNIVKDSLVVQHPVIHQTDGKRCCWWVKAQYDEGKKIINTAEEEFINIYRVGIAHIGFKA